MTLPTDSTRDWTEDVKLEALRLMRSIARLAERKSSDGFLRFGFENHDRGTHLRIQDQAGCLTWSGCGSLFFVFANGFVSADEVRWMSQEDGLVSVRFKNGAEAAYRPHPLSRLVEPAPAASPEEVREVWESGTGAVVSEQQTSPE